MKLSTITQIEFSSLCNNQCVYCPATAQKQHRPVGLMSWKTFDRCLHWIKHFCNRGTQEEINLAGIGESLLNPDFPAMVKKLRDNIPASVRLLFSTNGKLITEELVEKMIKCGIDEWVITDHITEDTARCYSIYRKYGILFVLARDAVTSPNSWAGQVDWYEASYVHRCHWIDKGKCMVYSDGRIVACCTDAFGYNILGSVFDDNIPEIEPKPSELCKTCHHVLPEEWAHLGNPKHGKIRRVVQA
jgi:hypothetical protein